MNDYFRDTTLGEIGAAANGTANLPVAVTGIDAGAAHGRAGPGKPVTGSFRFSQ